MFIAMLRYILWCQSHTLSTSITFIFHRNVSTLNVSRSKPSTFFNYKTNISLKLLTLVLTYLIHNLIFMQVHSTFIENFSTQLRRSSNYGLNIRSFFPQKNYKHIFFGRIKSHKNEMSDKFLCLLKKLSAKLR